jgi:hypothetical protein
VNSTTPRATTTVTTTAGKVRPSSASTSGVNVLLRAPWRVLGPWELGRVGGGRHLPPLPLFSSPKCWRRHGWKGVQEFIPSAPAILMPSLVSICALVNLSP